MERRNLDLWAVVAAAALGSLVVALGLPPALRVAPGLILVLVAPGYALAAALFPARLELPDRLVLTLGLSLALCVLVSIALDRMPVHLTERSWSLALAALTALAASTAGRRRRHARDRSVDGGGSQRQTRRSGARSERVGRGVIVVAALTASLAVIAAAFVIARAPASNVEGYALLWAIPNDRSHGRFTVGVTSSELTQTAFRVTAVAGGRTVFSRAITLAPGEHWTAHTRLRSVNPDQPTAVDVLLFRRDRPGSPYRRVRIGLGAQGF